jgi:signal transduction histidine kinase/CheY-like chemotaxis protein
MSRARTVSLNAALLIVYFAAGKFGLAFFALIHPSASAVWLPTGVAMAALLLGGFSLVPAVFAGAFLVNVTTTGSIASSLGVALGNTLEAVLAAMLVDRFAGGRHAFTSATGILKFGALAALLSTTVSATIGVTSLAFGGYVTDASMREVWLTWWFGDAAGAVLVTPLIVLWCTTQSLGFMGRRTIEAALMIAAIGAISAATFFHPALSQYPLAFLCLAPLVWGALRFGPLEIATAVVALAIFATAGTATGGGQFARLQPNEALLVLQGFLMVIAMTALPMAALTVERRTALARERAARADADASSRAKDEFLAILSHELRNPLAAINAAATALDAGMQTPPNDARLVASILRQARHLTRLIEDLLDIGRSTANKLSLQKEPLELGAAARRCVEALAAARGLSAGRIELTIQPVWIDADPVRITQIVENLIDNALKHTPADRRIQILVREAGAVAELRVEDDGFGIRAEDLPRVFEPFIQGEQGLDRSAGGLGLGLTLVRRLTELHGGTVEAQSAGVDRGSAFVLRFPRRSAPFEASAASGAPTRGRRAARLLIIEDNVDARQTLRALLEALGHEVHEAADGATGIAAALEHRPDLVFVDIGLPRLDGYEVARRLRAANARMRLVALTGYGTGDDVRRASEAGFDQHLLKPATLEQLRAAIDAVPQED